MIGEVTAKGIEVTAKAVVGNEVAKETGKAIVEKSVDVTKRLDVTKKTISETSSGVDIAKRIKPENVSQTLKDVSGKELVDTAKNYMKDLVSKSEVAETITEKMDISKLEMKSADQVAKLREAFDDNKPQIRSDWEKMYNRDWPRYDHDVFNDAGNRIRKAGDCYDAHHIQPLKLGGENVASNITPLDVFKHRDIHSAGGSCTKLVENVAGGMA